MIVKQFINDKKKFMLIYRFNYELSGVASKFFKDINTLFFPDYEMRDEKQGNGTYCDLYLNDMHCGYAVSMNNIDQLKKYSHMFSDTACGFMDEFQSETNHYCNNEIDKFIALHVTVARGQGKQSRYVPFYLCGNTVSLINPYYTALGITNRLTKNTKFLRGVGYALEQGYVESASQAQEDSSFMKAFSASNYVAYAKQAVYLNDNLAFIDKPKGNSRYLLTLKYKDAFYGVRSFDQTGIVYVDDRPDMSHPNKLAVTTEDHNVNYVMIKAYDFYIQIFRYYFERGCFRFRNLLCKEALMSAITF